MRLKNSIKTKLVFYSLVIILVPLLITTIFSVLFFLKEVEEEAVKNIRQDIRIASLIFQDKIEDLERLSRSLAMDPPLVSFLEKGDSPVSMERLRRFPGSLQGIEITVTDRLGRIKLMDPPFEESVAASVEDPFIARALEGDRPAACEAITDASTGKRSLSIAVAYPVYDRDEAAVVGAVRVRYRLKSDVGLLKLISGAVMGGVELFEGIRSVASAGGSGKDSTMFCAEELPVGVVRRTLFENSPFEHVDISRHGCLAEFEPILGLDGRPLGVLAVHTSAAEYHDLRVKSVIGLSAIASAMLVLGFLIGHRLQSGITRPIIELTERTKAVAEGDFSKGSLETKSRDEIGVLTESFNKMTLDLIRYMDNLEKTTAERERMSKELEIGHQIQQDFLPRTFPEHGRVEVFGESIPAREVGGDFFDVFMLDDRRMGLVIADVCGKGVPAALFMALSRSVLRLTALRGEGPKETLERVNRFVCADNDACMFATVFYGILDLQSGDLVYSNGGHNPPLVYRKGEGRAEVLAVPKGVPLGVMDDFEYLVDREVLEPGDWLLLYTDGIVEAPDRENGEFGMERLQALLADHANSSPEALCRLITKAVEEYSEGLEQFDDVTLLAARLTNTNDASVTRA